MFCSGVEAAVAKIFTKYKKISPGKMFLQTLNKIYPSSNIT